MLYIVNLDIYWLELYLLLILILKIKKYQMLRTIIISKIFNQTNFLY